MDVEFTYEFDSEKFFNEHCPTGLPNKKEEEMVRLDITTKSDKEPRFILAPAALLIHCI